MKITGIIAEFNPLHMGHKYLIDCAKKDSEVVICTVSGNFVQRGDTAIYPKDVRTKAALLCGADVVAEMSVLWSMSTAQNFSLAGVWELYNLGATEILFGSECGDITVLEKTAEILLSDAYEASVIKHLSTGITYARARTLAVSELGADSKILENPNDNLGIEYIIAAKKLHLPITFRCVKRKGALHDGGIDNGLASSSHLRELLLSGKTDEARQLAPENCRDLITENVSDITLLERAILSSLRTKSPEYFKNLPDISEGIENKLYAEIRNAVSLDGLFEALKSKRYTMARVRRIVLSAYLGLNKKFFMTTPPYIRLLGFSENGASYLKNIKTILPIITRVSQFENLDSDCKKIFASECIATDIYALSFKNPLECGGEYKYKIIKEGKIC